MTPPSFLAVPPLPPWTVDVLSSPLQEPGNEREHTRKFSALLSGQKTGEIATAQKHVEASMVTWHWQYGEGSTLAVTLFEPARESACASKSLCLALSSWVAFPFLGFCYSSYKFIQTSIFGERFTSLEERKKQCPSPTPQGTLPLESAEGGVKGTAKNWGHL